MNYRALINTGLAVGFLALLGTAFAAGRETAQMDEAERRLQELHEQLERPRRRRRHWMEPAWWESPYLVVGVLVVAWLAICAYGIYAATNGMVKL